MTARTLMVMRHAQAESGASADVDRALTASGRADAARAGAWLADRSPQPDRALVSVAVRTVQTWTVTAEAAGWSIEPTIDDALYEAGGQSVLDLVRAVPDDVATLIVVGHNPAMASLSLLFDDGEADPDLALAVATGFPTCAVATFEYAGSWADLEPGTARLRAFHDGRGPAGQSA